jgi:hypothetical protein
MMNLNKKTGLLIIVTCCLFAFSRKEIVAEKLEENILHSFFIAGPDFTGIIGEDGKEVWNSGKPGARDGFVLPNGHILICWADEVLEFDQRKKVIFTYKRDSEEKELGTAVRLKNGNTLITESGQNPVLLEVDGSGKIIKKISLLPETDNVHMQTRMARKLDNGHYLVPHLLAFAVKEYDPSGKVVKTFKTDTEELGGTKAENWPFTAIVLDNGNTLVSLTHGNKVVEFDRKGKVVWQVSNDDFTEKPFQDPCGIQRLPNGNTVIASYGAQKGIKIFEVTRDKKIVWTYLNHRAHELQILTTNGKPLTGKLLK